MYSAHCHLYMLSVHNMEQETKRKDIYILYNKLSWLEITILLVINFYIYNSMFSMSQNVKKKSPPAAALLLCYPVTENVPWLRRQLVSVGGGKTWRGFWRKSLHSRALFNRTLHLLNMAGWKREIFTLPLLLLYDYNRRRHCLSFYLKSSSFVTSARGMCAIYFAMFHAGLGLFNILLMGEVQEDKRCCRMARNAFHSEATCTKTIKKNWTRQPKYTDHIICT